jgi:hypothetical protein
MYIRFAQLQRDPVSRVSPGLFHALHRLPPFDGSDWRHLQIRDRYDWFNRHLDCPGQLALPVGKHAVRRGVCWFRDDATDHVSEARYLAWLLGDIGIPIRELRAERPGTLIWGDDHQIVAVPERNARIVVH